MRLARRHPSHDLPAEVGRDEAVIREVIGIEGRPVQSLKSKLAFPVFHRAFRALAAKLERKGVVGQVHVVDGPAMLLAYDSRVTSRDTDALFSPDGPMLEAIHEVADEMGWPRTWLNNQASSYVSRTPGEGSPVCDHLFLHVVAKPAHHLLAMKVVAAHSVWDGEDICLLLDRLRITTAAGVWEIVTRHFPGQTISDRSRLLVEGLLTTAAAAAEPFHG